MKFPNIMSKMTLQSVSDLVRLLWRRCKRAIIVLLTCIACIFIAWVVYFFYFYSLVEQTSIEFHIWLNTGYIIVTLSLAVWIANPLCIFQSQWRKDD